MACSAWPAATAVAVLLSTAGQPTLAIEAPDCSTAAPSVLAPPAWFARNCERPPLQRQEIPDRMPGDLLYSYDLRSAGGGVYSSPLPTMNKTLRGTPDVGAGGFIPGMDFDKAASALWVIVENRRVYGTINPATGAFSQVGAITGISNGEMLTGLRFDPTSDVVYVTSDDTVTSRLWSFDLATGVATLVGPIAGHPYTIDIAISNEGQMYGHDIQNNVIFKIDKTSGATEPVGPTGYACNYAQGMDFDPSTNTLYAFLYPAGVLATINLATGAATPVASDPWDFEIAVKLAVPTLRPAALAADTTGNGVLEVGETATVVPSWSNAGGGVPIVATATASDLGGPAGPSYSLLDAVGGYGAIVSGTTAACSDCYSLRIEGARPAQHWDAAFTETQDLGGSRKSWSLHLGDSFGDVPRSSGYYRFVETLLHKGVTGGCGLGVYCPSSSTSREQMAVFVLVAREGAGYSPTACSPPNVFTDVPETSPFCRFIEELANRGVVSGCGTGLYCPTSPVTREQMALFVLKTLDPALDPPACSPPNLFDDVPETNPFCRFIEELANRGVVSGCGDGNYCPASPVTREQMGVFLSVTFSLGLYGV